MISTPAWPFDNFSFHKSLHNNSSTQNPMEEKMTNKVADHSGGLARRSVTPFEVLAQSVANIAPSAVIAFGPGVMALYAGNGAWFSFVIGMGIILIVAHTVAVFARRRAGAGSLYSLVRPALGPWGSLVTGWALFIGVIAIASGSLAGAGFFASAFLEGLGANLFQPMVGQIVLDAILLAIAVYLTISGVRIAARVSATLEVLSIIVIIVMLVIVIVSSGNIFDSAQLTLTDATFDGMVFAVVLAILGFVGFESAAALGEEAQDPYRAIPRAIRRGAIFAGILYIFATYVQVAAFEGGAEGLGKSLSPMDDLAAQYGLDGFVPLLNLGFAASFMAVVIACMTVAARLLFAWGNEGLISSWFGQAHPKHRTPARAIYTIIPLVFLPMAIVLSLGVAPLGATTYIDTVGVFGYMFSYILVCIGAPIFLKKTKGKNVIFTMVLGIVGALSLLYVFYRNVWPIPATPLDSLPIYFIVALIVGVVFFAILRIRKPAVAAQAGTFADDNPDDDTDENTDDNTDEPSVQPEKITLT
jgi:amino acid transporter